jgi:PAS domain S-box-containing protein
MKNKGKIMPNSKPMRILYMEDEAGLARLLQKHLQREGYEVDIAANGAEGIVMLEDNAYDVLLVDYDMPVYDGLEVIRTLAERETLPASIMVTGHGDENVAVEAMKLGAADYIIKDVEMTYLQLLPFVIERVIHKQELTREKERLFEIIQESEERYKLLVEFSPDGIAVHANEKWTFMNPTGARVLGATRPEDLLGKSIFDFVHPDYHPLIKKELQSMRLGAQSTWVEGRFIRLDGTEVDVEIASVSFIYKGKPAVQVIFRDITEQKQTLEALQKSQEQYSCLFEHSPISLWEEDFSRVKQYINRLRASGIKDFRIYFDARPEEVVRCASMVKIVEVNEATLALYQAESVEAFENGLGQIFGQEAYDVFKEELITIAEGQTKFRSEAVTQTLNGEKNHIILEWCAALGHEETLSKVFVSILDITEHKRIEEALREGERRFRGIIENTQAGYFYLDRAGRYQDVNKAWLEMHGYISRDEVIGQHFSLTQVDSDLEDAQRNVDQLLKGTPIPVGEAARRYKDGSIGYHTFSAHPVIKGGRILGLEGFIIDTTERRQVELALLQRNRELELLNRAGRAFVSTLDLDNVLATILEEVRLLLGVVACSAWLVDRETGELVCHYVTDPQSEIVRGWRLAPGEGLASWVAERGKSLNVPDVLLDKRHYKGVDQKTGLPVRSILTVPLKVRKGEVIGVFQVVDAAASRFTQRDLTLVESLASTTSWAIENAQLYDDLKASQEYITKILATEHEQRLLAEILSEVTLALTSQISHEAVLDEILRQMQRLVPHDTANIVMLEGGILRMARWRGYDKFGIGKMISNLRQPLADYPLEAEVVQTRKPLVTPDVRQEPRWVVLGKTAWISSNLIVPICHRDSVLGLLRLDSQKPGEFSVEDAKRLQPLASAAAIALENARLYEQALQDYQTKLTLLNEVNHRVKNNLAAIIGLLYTEQHHVGMYDQATCQTIIKNLINRIQGLATVHNLLSDSEWRPISLNTLTQRVVQSALQILPPDKQVVSEIHPSSAQVTAAQANNLALIINELTMNAIKYALSDKRNTLKIVVKITQSDDTIRFEFRDDGPGYPEQVLQGDREHFNGGFDLIYNIVHKNLGGALSLFNDNGAVTVFQFKDEKQEFKDE